MKSWSVMPEVLRDPALSDLAENARTTLESEIGPAAGLVDGTLALAGEPNGRRKLALRISDRTWPSGVEATFDPDELRSELHTRRKLRWLWGDLLQARNHHQIRQLEHAAG